jgi:hypothetical protein
LEREERDRTCRIHMLPEADLAEVFLYHVLPIHALVLILLRVLSAVPSAVGTLSAALRCGSTIRIGDCLVAVVRAVESECSVQ